MRFGDRQIIDTAAQFRHPLLLARLCLAVLLAAFLAAGGCSRSSNGRLAISGKVTLDGTPLDQGLISFNPAKEKMPSAGAAIVAGAYHMPATKGLLPGMYKVAIDSADPNGATATPAQYTMRIPVSRIPLNYNGETTLTAQVTDSGPNQFDFDLTSTH
jgi:hypothetical protein